MFPRTHKRVRNAVNEMDSQEHDKFLKYCKKLLYAPKSNNHEENENEIEMNNISDDEAEIIDEEK